MATINSKIGETYFVWKGPTTKGARLTSAFKDPQ